MLYLLYGKDILRSRKKLNEILDFFRSKNKDVSIFKIDEYDFEKEKLEELLGANTLFGGKVVVVFNRILGEESVSRMIMEKIDRYAASKNIFIFYEEEVDKDILGLFKENSAKIQRFDKGPSFAKGEGRSFKGEGRVFFAICDAVAEKNNIRAWILFQQALMDGIDAEEIFWKIWWQIKSLLMVKNLFELSQGPTFAGREGRSFSLEKETGLHPYVVKKNLSAIHNFDKSELQNYSFHLVKLYHDARRGMADFEIGLEKILISI